MNTERCLKNYHHHKNASELLNRDLFEVNPTYTEYFSWGNDSKGQLGHGKDNGHVERKLYLPKSLSFDVIIQMVACGSSHTVFLTNKS